MNLSVVVLTFNETVNVPRLLKSIEGLGCALFVVDSGSTDGTAEMMEAAGARVVRHGFESHARQWRWALENLPLRTEWVLALDADQALTPECAEELRELFGRAAALDGVSGLYFNRRQVFRGRWIRHGGYYPKYLLKAFRRNEVVFDEHDLVDHHFYVKGATRKLRHDLVEQNEKEDDITFWIEKHNRYAGLMAKEEVARWAGAAAAPRDPSLLGDPDERILWLKRVWRELPLFVRPFLYFFYRYFLRLGVLDGRQGAIFHFMQALWFRLLIDIKIDELKLRKADGAAVR